MGLCVYYLNSRYYIADWGRFASADALLSTEQGMIGNNMFAYCGNNPVLRSDTSGNFWETVFDVVSLCVSIVDVASNPRDPWAWAGLVADAVDLIPFVTGVGEVVRGLNVTRKALDTVDTLNDARKAAKTVSNTYQTAKTGKKALSVTNDTKKAVSMSTRSSAVRKAWKNELLDVQNGGTGISRTWSNLEIEELMSTGKVKGYQGHHMKSVKGYPELAGDPNNIQFLTRAEHFAAHGGNWKNITHGRYIF